MWMGMNMGMGIAVVLWVEALYTFEFRQIMANMMKNLRKLKNMLRVGSVYSFPLQYDIASKTFKLECYFRHDRL